MSQSGILNAKANGANVQTLTGNTGGPVPASNNNINVVGDGTTITIAGNPGTNTLTASLITPVSIADGGTNATSMAHTDGVVYFDGTRLVTTTVGTATQVLTSNGAGMAPTFQNASGSGVETIDGDTGSATGSTITFHGGGLGGTVTFTASGAAVGMTSADANNNTMIGTASFNPITGTNNCGFGLGSLQELSSGSDNAAFGGALILLTSGEENVGVGGGALEHITTQNGCTAVGFNALKACTAATNTAMGLNSLLNATTGANTAFGNDTLINLVTGTACIAIGSASGSDYTGSESSNIVIGNLGTVGESNVIRIGKQGSGLGQQNFCYVAGITGATPTSADTPQVVLCDNTGNLTVISSSTSGYVLTSNGSATPSFQAPGGGVTPGFQAGLTGDMSNVTGDGTTVQVLFNGVTFDNSSNFNTGTSTFTAPETGNYLLITNISIEGLISTNTIEITIVTTSFSANIVYTTGITGSPNIFNGSSILHMGSGDTAIVNVTVYGVSKVCSIQGDPHNTAFYGYLL